ncbi:MAG: hypothetical protein IPL98_01685 [Saprospiraceae bacterium]|nr:hypothetical protein [Saprospiraceae bacterium]
MKYLYTLVIFVSLITSSCYQEEEKKYEKNLYNIKFSKTPLKYGVAFNWDVCKISTFVEYIITKSIESTPALTKLADLKSSDVYARIKSRDSTKVLDTSTIENSYYRLYINFGHGLIASDELYVDFLNFSLAGQGLHNYLVDYVNGNLYLFYTNQTIEAVDLANMKTKAIKLNQTYNFSYSPSLGYGRFGKTEVYIPYGDKIILLDGDNLEVKDTFDEGTKGATIFNTVTDIFSNIYYTESYGATSAVLSKYIASTGKIIRLGDVKPTSNVIRVTKDGKYVLVGSINHSAIVSLYTLNNNGMMISNISSQYNIVISSNLSFTTANLSSLIISGNSTLYDNLVSQKVLSNVVPAYFSSSFSTDDKFIYIVESTQKLVYKIENRNPYNKFAIYQTRLTPQYFFVYNNEGYSISKLENQNTGVSKLYLEKLKL